MVSGVMGEASNGTFRARYRKWDFLISILRKRRTLSFVGVAWTVAANYCSAEIDSALGTIGCDFAPILRGKTGRITY